MLAFDASGRGTDPRIVLLHGWPLDRTIWADVARRLAHAGFRVLCPDLPGFGESPPMDFDRASMEAYADDVAAFLRPFGPEPLGLVGHSFGGYVALALAERHPDRLAGLGLVASRALPDTPAARHGRQETIEAVRARGTGALLPGLVEKLLGPKAVPAWREKAMRQVERARPDGTIAGLRAMASRPDRTKVLDAFPGPRLVVHGTEDLLIPVAEAARPRPVRASDVRLLLPEVGHMPMWEAPTEMTEALVRWARNVFLGKA